MGLYHLFSSKRTRVAPQMELPSDSWFAESSRPITAGQILFLDFQKQKRTDGPVVGRGLIFARTRVRIQVSAYLSIYSLFFDEQFRSSNQRFRSAHLHRFIVTE